MFGLEIYWTITNLIQARLTHTRLKYEILFKENKCQTIWMNQTSIQMILILFFIK